MEERHSRESGGGLLLNRDGRLRSTAAAQKRRVLVLRKRVECFPGGAMFLFSRELRWEYIASKRRFHPRPDWHGM